MERDPAEWHVGSIWGEAWASLLVSEDPSMASAFRVESRSAVRVALGRGKA